MLRFRWLTGRTQNDEECEDSVATKVHATTAVGFARGRRDTNSRTSSSSSSMSQEEDQKIDGEGDAVMHMSPPPALNDEYHFCFSAKGGGMFLNSVRLVDNLSMMWPRSFRRRKFAAEPVHEDFELDGVLTVALCVH